MINFLISQGNQSLQRERPLMYRNEENLFEIRNRRYYSETHRSYFKRTRNPVSCDG